MMINMQRYFNAGDAQSAGGGAKVLDTHVHFWKFDRKRDAWITDDMKILQQNYLPEQLAGTLHRNGVDGVIAVQADQQEVETRFLVELAKTHPLIRGVVGWVDLQAENIADRLDHFSQFSIIKGFRHVAQAEPDDFLLQKNFQRGIAALQTHNYSYDILIYQHQLPAALQLVRKFPGQRFIIDHCAKPDIRSKNISDWKILMAEIAKCPNVCCKLSGLFTEAKWSSWTPADFYPCLDTVFEAFGTDRLVFGSDWPVILVAGMYVQWKSLLEKYMEKFKLEDREKVFGLNGAAFYEV